MALPAIGEKAPETILLPDVHRLDQMPSLPEWVVLRVESMKDETQPSLVDGKYRTLTTLPKTLMLNDDHLVQVKRYIAASESLCAQTPINEDKWEIATLSIVTQMMLVLPSSQQNDVGAEASGEAFQAALDDVPHWAVAAAMRRWYRGECGLNERGHPYDYHWRPAPAELRRIALSEMWRIKESARLLRRLLAAEPLVEFSAEHRERMGKKFRALLMDLRVEMSLADPNRVRR
jgi:hypothetical protein